MSENPTFFIIFGATGDLARNKLFPALIDLYNRDLLPLNFKVVGFSRRDWRDKEFRDFISTHLKENTDFEFSVIDEFLKNTLYIKGTFEQSSSYGDLADLIVSLEGEYGKCGDKLFYLAVPPSSYMEILKNVADSGLSVPCSGRSNSTRVLIEKPFGRDVGTAQELDKILGLLFQEEQIFRIDHYLAKESLQNILTFRFFNPIFSPIWNKENIEKIELSIYEKEGVEDRGSFYDGIGALRDVGQNHLLQMLALVAMEKPESWDSKSIRERRASVLKTLIPPEMNEENVKRGQYEGYGKIKGVNDDSSTETYFKIKTYLDMEYLESVPIILEGGKALDRSEVAIRVFFKKEDCCLHLKDGDYGGVNQLTFRIQPDEGINLHFWFKSPGFGMKLEEKTLKFLYNENEDESETSYIPDAYERVLYDCIEGDQTLFASTDEVSAAWRFITPILEGWNDLPMIIYKKKSDSENINN